jgi:hypothetical protein
MQPILQALIARTGHLANRNKSFCCPCFRSMNSDHVLWLCHKFLTPKYRAYVEQAQNTIAMVMNRSLPNFNHLRFWARDIWARDM